jgi:Sulfotransferase family
MNTFDGFCSALESKIRTSESDGVGTHTISCYAFVKKSSDFTQLEKFICDNWKNEYFVEKTPNSIFCLSQLFNKYPNSKYIFLERHPVKILLSQMNLFPPGESDRRKRAYDLLIGNIEEKELLLNYQQHRANQVLKMVKAQVNGKARFPNQITIRYENLISNLEFNLSLLQSKFNITPNVERAKEILRRPSVSSRHNKYHIKSISDPDAIEMMNEACYLWNYEPYIL